VKTEKIIAIIFIGVLVLNIILLALNAISDMVFWIIIVISFIVSYIIKKINKREK
jgi:hypothetical protein